MTRLRPPRPVIAQDRRGLRASSARRAVEDQIVAMLRERGVPMGTREIEEKLGPTKPWRNPSTGEFAWHHWNAYPVLKSLERLGLVVCDRFPGWRSVFWSPA